MRYQLSRQRSSIDDFSDGSGQEMEVVLIRRGKQLRKKVVLGSLNGRFYGRQGGRGG